MLGRNTPTSTQQPPLNTHKEAQKRSKLFVNNQTQAISSFVSLLKFHKICNATQCLPGMPKLHRYGNLELISEQKLNNWHI